MIVDMTIVAEIQMEETDGLALGQDRDAAIPARSELLDMGTRELYFLLSECIDTPLAQPPAFIRRHRAHARTSAPGLGPFQDAP
jgi:hypothetical protein